jgi:phosphatidylinositol phospholipase C delta
MWNNTLRTLYAVREELRSGRGGVERREIVWERMWWRVARGFVVVGEGGGGGGGKKEGDGEGEEERVGFEQVEKMCRKLNIHSSSEDLLRRFQASLFSLLSLTVF